MSLLPLIYNKGLLKTNFKEDKMKTLRKIGIGALIASALSYRDVNAGSWAKVTSQHDSRDFSTVTLTGGASGLPFGMGTFGFIESETEKGNRDNLKQPYGEINLSEKGQYGFGAIAEYNRDFSSDRGVTRIGLVFEPKLSFFFGTKFYPISTANSGIQIGVYGNKKFNEGDEYVEGFVDYNFKPGKFVGEVQVGRRIKGNLFGVIEGRYNGFKPRKTVSGAGLEWKL